jgi:predicted DCC family thiol-disulfide oxidoreductase YuxK
MQAKPLLIFDGDCGFCTTATNFILKHTSTPLLAEPYQFIDPSAYGLTLEQVQAKVYLVLDGKNYSGHEAFANLFKIQKNLLLRSFGYLILIPPFVWLARPGYALVAKYRQKLPGGTPACKMPRN